MTSESTPGRTQFGSTQDWDFTGAIRINPVWVVRMAGISLVQSGTALRCTAQRNRWLESPISASIKLGSAGLQSLASVGMETGSTKLKSLASARIKLGSAGLEPLVLDRMETGSAGLESLTKTYLAILRPGGFRYE